LHGHPTQRLTIAEEKNGLFPRFIVEELISGGSSKLMEKCCREELSAKHRPPRDFIEC
jgi:hypothetical protein